MPPNAVTSTHAKRSTYAGREAATTAWLCKRSGVLPFNGDQNDRVLGHKRVGELLVSSVLRRVSKATFST